MKASRNAQKIGPKKGLKDAEEEVRQDRDDGERERRGSRTGPVVGKATSVGRMLASAAMPPDARRPTASSPRGSCARRRCAPASRASGIARAGEPPAVRAVHAAGSPPGRHAGMRYLEDTRAAAPIPARAPRRARARSSASPRPTPPRPASPRTARGSPATRAGADYHGTPPRAGARASSAGARRAARRARGAARVCVDSTPIAERAFAAAAGLGWIGKNGCLIDARAGLATCCSPRSSPTSTCRPTRPSPSSAAPARAASTPARPTPSSRRASLDAGRCIAYWTIEHRGADPGRVEGGRRRPRLRLRRLPGGLSLERAAGARGAAPAPPAADARRDPRRWARAPGAGASARPPSTAPRGAASSATPPLSAGRQRGRGVPAGARARPRASQEPGLSDAARWALGRLEARPL